MSTNVILFGVLFILAAVALIFIVHLEVRLHRLFRGPKGENLETLMNDVVTHVQSLHDATTRHGESITTLLARLQKHGYGVKLTRFNSFADTGGNQSFAVAFVNEEGDGVVFSSLYSRDRMSVFAKPIANGVSAIELTDEEKTVVSDARQDARR